MLCLGMGVGGGGKEPLYAFKKQVNVDFMPSYQI